MLKQLKQTVIFGLLSLTLTPQALSMNAEAKKADAAIKQQEKEESYERMLEVCGFTYQQIEEDIEDTEVSLEGLERRLQNLIAKVDKLAQQAIALNMQSVAKRANKIKDAACADLLYVMELIE